MVQVRIVSRRLLTPNVVELALQAPGALDYRPGQWISLRLPVGEKPPLVRAYTLAALPDPSGRLVLALDRVPGGLGSRYLFSLLPGAVLEAEGPLGRFVPPDEPVPQLWIARYTGIVPFRPMWQALDRRRDRPLVRLLYQVPDESEAPYLDEIRELPWLELRLLTEREPGDPAPVLEVLDRTPPDPAGPVPMVCGTRSFVRPIRECLHGLGFDRKAIRWECYD